MTGLVLVRFANLYWLVTVSGFQGSSCSRFRLLPAVLPAACRLCCVRRQGDTLRIRLDRVNRLSELFFGVFRAEFLLPDPRGKSASRFCPEGADKATHRPHHCGYMVAMLASPNGFPFSTRAPVSCVAPAVRCRTVHGCLCVCKGLSHIFLFPSLIVHSGTRNWCATPRS